jgi:hypothetical protein
MAMGAMIRWLFGLWYARLRRIDIELLWPTCRDKAQNLDHARAAFAVHAFHDRAWLVLGDDEILEIIDGLA